MQLGASGCQIGTRFVCATESIAHENFKKIFIKSEARNTQVSVKLDERFPIIPVRAIENSATKEFVNEQKKLLILIEEKKISLREAQLEIEHFLGWFIEKCCIKWRYREWFFNGRSKCFYG